MGKKRTLAGGNREDRNYLLQPESSDIHNRAFGSRIGREF